MVKDAILASRGSGSNHNSVKRQIAPFACGLVLIAFVAVVPRHIESESVRGVCLAIGVVLILLVGSWERKVRGGG